MNYSEQLKHPKWQKKRLKILERDDFKCVICNDAETTLNIHHKKYNGKKAWESKDEDLCTLCEDCHKHIYEIESITKNDHFKCLNVSKWKNKNYIIYYLVLGECKIGKGLVVLDVSNDKSVYFIKKEHIEKAIKIINHE